MIGKDNSKIENEINEKNKNIKNIEEQIEAFRKVSLENIIIKKKNEEIEKSLTTQNFFNCDEKEFQTYKSNIVDISSKNKQSEKYNVNHKTKEKEKVLLTPH